MPVNLAPEVDDVDHAGADDAADDAPQRHRVDGVGGHAFLAAPIHGQGYGDGHGDERKQPVPGNQERPGIDQDRVKRNADDTQIDHQDSCVPPMMMAR